MRVNEEVRKCIVYICIFGKTKISPIGTGFIVGVNSKTKKGMSYCYLVTAKHVAKRLQNKPFCVRINDKKGSSGFIRGDETTWFYHPTDNSTDVAVTPFSASQEIFDFKMISVDNFLSDDIIKQGRVGIGDEVFIVGLFAHASGTRKNQPIVRIGNIAMIPDEPIPSSVLGDIEAYLIEARSIGGLSGSPAFVREGLTIGVGQFHLLGLMHGHWDIPPEKKNDFIMGDEILGKVNMGIAIVIPAKKILEVINHPVLVDLREKKDKMLTT